MKKLILLLLLAGPAHAEEPFFTYEKLWTGDTLTDSLFVTHNALIIADWAQTRYIAEDPANFHERSYELDPNPTTREVNGYFLGVIIVHNLIYFVLPDKWKPFYSAGHILDRATTIKNNRQLGIGFEF